MTWIFLVSAGAILAALSNISLKHGLTQVSVLVPEVYNVFQRIPYLATNLFIWLGVVGLGAAFLCWLTGLSQVKLNIAYPVLVGLEYSLVMVLSWLVLGEAFVSFKLAGIMLVLIGIVIITY
jgi:multidrug transporter EmrE-like cation transporter